MKKLLTLLLLLPIFSYGQVNIFPWVNDFESFITLEEDLNDDGDWVLRQGSTPSYNTGPSGDHTTGSGVYYYVESSYPNYPDQTFITYTPTFDVSATPGKVLSFWYHMYGTAMGDLEIGVLDNNGYTVLDTKSGNHGDQWYFAYYPIASTDSFKIQFTAITGSSYTSDICIDDIMISDAFSPAIGCMDSTALNYDASAVYPDGSCTYPPCGGFLSSNAYELCWGSQTGIVFEWWSDTSTSTCDVIELHYGDENNHIYSYMGFWPAANGYNNFAVSAGNGQMPPNWSLEHYLVLEYADGTLSDSILYTPSPCIYGCTDSTAVSYNPWATIDDGSCGGTACDPATEYQISMEIKLDNWPGEVSWTMVTNAGANVVIPAGTYNYNDVGQTYTYDFCVSSTAGFEFIINDTYGDGMAGNGTPGAAGEVVIYDCAGDTITYLSSGTWLDGNQNLVGVNFGSVAYSTPQSGVACNGPPVVLGCLDPAYQEFNPLANADDSSCVNLHIFGCMDSTMFNYDPNATQVNLIPACDYTLIIEDDAADGWGNSYIGVAQGNNTWIYTMGPGFYSQSFPINLDSDKPVVVYYFEVPGAQQTPQSVEFQTMQNSVLLINAYGDTLLSEGTNPFANNGQGALQPFASPFWTTYSAVPACGDYCEPVVFGCMDVVAYNYNNLANTNDTCYYQPGCTNPGYLEYYTQGYTADIDDGSCSVLIISGCTDATAFNYDPLANLDNGGCIPVIMGCMQALAFNYNPQANTPDTCIAIIYGCMSSIAINYDPLANTDDGSCIGVTYGCTDSSAFNYSPSANADDGSCEPFIYGCMDATMFNYNALANTDNNSCIPFVYGCMDTTAFNYNPLANADNGSCIPYIYGCTNPTALNYDAAANVDDGSCISPTYGCTDSTMYNYNPLANTDNGSCIPFIYGCTNPNALNYDPLANTDDLSCIGTIYGCTDSTAFNYNPLANFDNNSCVPVIMGCTDPSALNYCDSCNTDDFSCILPIYGCTDSTAYNYNSLANIDNGSCIPVIWGCTDPMALNYDSDANTDDHSCIIPIYGCTDSTMFNYNPLANVDNSSCIPFIFGCTDPSMLNYDFLANTEDFTCIPYIYGCMDSTALNYDSLANTDNESCVTIVEGCMDQSAYNYNVSANVHDSISCLYDAGCVTGAGNPYWLNDPCYAWVISIDDYCCNNEWDNVCQSTYDYCEGTWVGPLLTRKLDDNIIVYPNPASDKININKNVDINIFNSIGDMIISKQNTNVLDVSKLTPGVYNLQITRDNKTINKKIIKQ